MEVLEARLRGRGTETDDKIAKRLATAVEEIAYAGVFRVRVSNLKGTRSIYYPFKT